MDDETRAAFEALMTRMNPRQLAVMASLTTLLIAMRWTNRQDTGTQERPLDDAP